MKNWPTSLGAHYSSQNDTCSFLAWAPFADQLSLEMILADGTTETIAMEKILDGYYALALKGVRPGTDYFYRFNQLNRRPDPASRYQPQGVFGPSQVVDHFTWTDDHWHGRQLKDYIIYELHVGLYTQAGTLDAIITHLEELRDLGITAIELMPVAQFSGTRNWGYDGVFPYAVQNSYGGPNALKRLVNACHEKGLAVILDVVYNHLGPEGNYFAEFGPYFTSKYKIPWGNAINFDDAGSDEVRRYFIDNALYWLRDCHIDALRLDAVQNIMDYSSQHFLEQLAQTCKQASRELKREFYLIAESNLNDIKIISPKSHGGYGIDAQWNDEFHHALYALMSGEKKSYYADFGELKDLLKAYREGFVYSGQYSQFRQHAFGNSSLAISPEQLVIFAQNHDQIGNFGSGDRLSAAMSLSQLQLIAAVTVLSPYIPLIFMGEEYAETAPFYFFIDFMDKNLIANVQKGRIQEMRELGLEHAGYDVESKAVFERCKLHHSLKNAGQHRELLEFYKTLFHLRKTNSALADLTKEGMRVWADESQKVMFVKRVSGNNEVLLIFNFNNETAIVRSIISEGTWSRILSTQTQAENLKLVADSILAIPSYAVLVFNRFVVE